MTLARSDFDNLSEDDLQALKENAVSEGISLDYKRDAYGRSDAENKEFLKDITSFANTTGGHILIGVDEDEGIPTDIRGVEIDCDAEVGRLENLLRDRIEPRVVGIRLLQVPLDNGKRVLAVRIPRSWNTSACGDPKSGADNLRKKFSRCSRGERRRNARNVHCRCRFSRARA